MKQFVKNNDVGLRFLSLLLAFIVWAIVIAEDNPERSPEYKDIKLSVSGEAAMHDETGLSVVTVETNLISVVVRGPNNDVTDKSTRQRINATLDVSALNEAGDYDLRPSVSVNRNGIEVVSFEPETVRVRVDELTSREVPVKIETVGEPQSGYRAGKPYLATGGKDNTVTIEGPRSELEEVAYAYTSIDASGLVSTKKADCPITLCMDSGELFESNYVSCRTSRVNVALPIYKINTIPLSVSLKDGGTVKAEQAEARINPESIKVIGDQKTIAEMGELSLGELDLGSVRTDVPLELPITLPDGVRLDEGQPETAQVTVKLAGVSTRKLDITRFALNDTSADSTPYQVSVLTDSVEIELRGTEGALNEVDEQAFSIGLTFDSVSLGEGNHEVKAVVAATALPNGVTLVEEDVTVQLRIGNGNAGDVSNPAGGQGVAAALAGVAAPAGQEV